MTSKLKKQHKLSKQLCKGVNQILFISIIINAITMLSLFYFNYNVI